MCHGSSFVRCQAVPCQYALSRAAEFDGCTEQDFFSKWGQEGTIDFAKTFSELIILTASRTLMGTDSAPFYDAVNAQTRLKCKELLELCTALLRSPCTGESSLMQHRTAHL